MKVWLLYQHYSHRTWMLKVFDTREAALQYLERVAVKLQVDLLDEGNGAFYVGLQEYNLDRHRVNLTNRRGVKSRWRQMPML